MSEADQIKELQRILLQLLNSVFDDREYLYIMSRLCGTDQDFDFETDQDFILKNLINSLKISQENCMSKKKYIG